MQPVANAFSSSRFLSSLNGFLESGWFFCSVLNFGMLGCTRGFFVWFVSIFESSRLPVENGRQYGIG